MLADFEGKSFILFLDTLNLLMGLINESAIKSVSFVVGIM